MKKQKSKLSKKQKKLAEETWKKRGLLADKIDIKNATKKELLFSIKDMERLLQNQQRLIQFHQSTIVFQRDTISQQKKGIEIFIGKYEERIQELEKELQECSKQRNDSIRAYNGLAQMGKFAEQMRINLEEACKKLPEADKNKYDFSHKHTVLESGKVKHSYHLKPKKNGKGK